MWSTLLSICAWVDIGHTLRQRSHSSMGGRRFGQSWAWGRPGWGSALPPWEAGRGWVPVHCLLFPFGLGSCPLTFLTEKLRRQLKETQWAAFAEGTHKNLLTQWTTFLVFCDRYQCQAMPVSTDMICLYTGGSAYRGLSITGPEANVQGGRRAAWGKSPEAGICWEPWLRGSSSGGTWCFNSLNVTLEAGLRLSWLVTTRWFCFALGLAGFGRVSCLLILLFC